MVALFSPPPPPQFSSLGWLLEEPISQQNMNYICGDNKTEISDSIALQHTKNKDAFAASFNDGLVVYGDEGKMMKKLNHNASERDRRKKINTLYSTLRSLLPPEDHSRKLSIPTTVSRVLNYIPELQKEVERLSKKRERLTSSKAKIEEEEAAAAAAAFSNKKKRMKSNERVSVISATPISDREIVFHISMSKTEKLSISEAVMRLENEGFIAINAASFQSFDGRLFYNLHLQAQGSQVPMDAEMLKKKVWPF
ncbi:transcription factor org2 [Phtheirospermum japonicum]|uniref:Transcription factor org2 n=1 Tax=Phtheirospermum japonicum TaxID=374723 RepID=A0A830B094_9LAMI|nr:transcription factor org2 [Phtheirospermum japonicum]